MRSAVSARTPVAPTPLVPRRTVVTAIPAAIASSTTARPTKWLPPNTNTRTASPLINRVSRVNRVPHAREPAVDVLVDATVLGWSGVARVDVTPRGQGGGHDRCSGVARRGHRPPRRGRGVGAGAATVRRSGPDPLDLDRAVQSALAPIVADLAARSHDERDASVRAALQQVALMNREQLGSAADQVSADLAAKKDVIGTRLDEVRSEMRGELHRLSQLVTELGTSSAQRFGEVDQSLRSHAEVAGHLAESTRALREALANPQARGQWGERMAEDVLRLAGFVEHVNYRKQTQVVGSTGRPDYTFDLPKGHVLYMDVKFPMAAYLRYLEVGTAAEREAHLKAFLRDVRARIKELSKREYAQAGDQTQRRLRADVPAQRAAHVVHLRTRPGAARRGDGPASGHVLAAHLVRLPGRHPAGVRQLRDRADQRRDPASCSASSASNGRSTPSRPSG